MHPAALPADQLLAECELARVKRSGPGGQRRNKVETGVRLRHRPTGFEAEASERRSPLDNQRAALRRLRLRLALRHRQPSCDSPSGLWSARCREKRIQINPQHDEFPAILAEALDAIATHHFEVKVAAGFLGCSPSQLIKLLKVEPKALALVNENRKQRELSRLQ